MLSRDEFRQLQDKSSRVDKLENEISTLRRQSRDQEAAPNDTRLTQQKAAENDQLAKDNARLADELKTYRSTSLEHQPQKSEEQNKGLTAELRASRLQKHVEQAEQDAHKIPKSSDSVLTPISTNSSLLPCRVAKSGSKSIALETYNSLVTKYNLVFQNWTDIKATRAQLEVSLRAEKDKAKRYNLFCDGLEKKLIQKRDKIRQLDTKVRHLEDEIQLLRHTHGSEVEKGIQRSVDGGILGDESRDGELAQLSTPNAMLLCQPITDKVRRTAEVPVVNNITTSPHRLDFPASDREGSSCKDGQPEDARSAGQDNARDYSQQPDQHDGSESNGLPMLLGREEAQNFEARNIQSELTEPHHSSSTQSHQPSHSPNGAGSQGITIKMESPGDRHSVHDTPVVIQARSVKKRNAPKDSASTGKVKVETISSSPIGLPAFSGLEAHESIDLDDIGHKQITPRKQRSLMQKLSGPVLYGSRSGSRSARKGVQGTEYRSLPDSVAKEGHALLETPTTRGGLRTDSAPSSNSVNQVLPRTSSYRASKRRRITSDIAIEELVEDGGNLVTMEWSGRSETSSSDGLLMKLLENPSPTNRGPMKPNLSVPVHTIGDESKLLVMSSATSTPAIQATSVASGGMASRSSLIRSSSNSIVARKPSPENISKVYTHSPRQKSKDRFSAREGISDLSMQGNLSTTQDELSRLAYADLQRGTGTPQPPQNADNLDTNPRKSSATEKRHSPPQESRLKVTEDSENVPLRSRSLDRLALHDFKINPKYNGGYDYAFTDVVRNQAARRCLPGCTKSECCGNAFRALAAAAWDPNKPPTASQDETETRLIKDFLGDNAYKIRDMTKAERDETLLQAKTRELANRHGKHRHAYERRRSPPGFWRLDFPSTQEEREDHQKIEQLERDLVAQRYQEAMRPGGAYLFRDE